MKSCKCFASSGSVSVWAAGRVMGRLWGNRALAMLNAWWSGKPAVAIRMVFGVFCWCRGGWLVVSPSSICHGRAVGSRRSVICCR